MTERSQEHGLPSFRLDLPESYSMVRDTKKPAWQLRREEQAEQAKFQKLTEYDAKHGTNRDIYLLMDRIFFTSSASCINGILGYKAEDKSNHAVIRTKDGPRHMNRMARKAQIQERDENIKEKRKARKRKAQKQARTTARQRRLRSKKKNRR